jgi:hypothetical protein
MSIAKIKIALGTLVVAGLGTTMVFEYRSLGRLREQNQALEQRVAQLRQSAGTVAPTTESQSPDNRSAQREQQIRDLDRLRGEVGALRKERKDLAALHANNRELRATTDEPLGPAEAEFEEQTEMRTRDMKQWGLSFLLYARAHKDQYPETFEQAAGAEGSDSRLGFATSHFEIVYRGTTEAVKEPGTTILFRENQARRSPKGDWVRVYGFVDGHVEAHIEPDEAAFAVWEQGRIAATSTATNTSVSQP